MNNNGCDENISNYNDLFTLIQKPLSVHIELTYKCNLRCRHCYIDQTVVNEELKLEDWKFACDYFINNGIFLFVISGGEPLISSCFLELYRYLWMKGARIILFSNLLLLNNYHVNEFIIHPPMRIESSIYGCSEKTHELITQKEGSYSLLIQNVKLLKSIGIQITLKTPVMTNNYLEIDRIEEYVKNELKCDYRYGYDIEFNGKNKELILNEQQLISFIESKKGLHAHIQRIIDYSKSISNEDNNQHALFQCKAGRISIACDPFGNIKTCISDISLGNVLKTTNNLNKRIASRIADTIDKKSDCFNCKLKILCEFCPAKSCYDKALSCKKAKAIAKFIEEKNETN